MRRLLFPFILIVAAVLLRRLALNIEPVYLHLLDFVPYVVLGLAGALCVYFNRARIFTTVCVLLVVYYLTQTTLQTPLTDITTLYIYTVLSLLVPATLMLLMFVHERGLRNQYGMFMVSIVPLQLMITVILYHSLPEAAWVAAINTWMPVHPFAASMLSVPAIIVFTLALLVGLIMLHRRDSEYDALLVVLLIIVCIAFAHIDLPAMPMAMFNVAGISVIVSLLRRTHEMAYHDELTGLFGRRAFNERLRGLGSRYVIAMLDVDHFKNFNDTYGHDIGDDVLKMVAQRIAAVQGGGIAYRYGGEEFSIVFPGKDIADCKPFLEDVRKAVEDYRMLIRNRKQRPKTGKAAKERRGRRTKQREEKNVSVTISIGVSAPKNKPITVDEVLKAADAALYKAKQSGRNCIATK